MGGVGSHSKQILRKLGAQTSAHAVFLACAAGTLDPTRRHGDHAGSRLTGTTARSRARRVGKASALTGGSGVRRVKPPKLPRESGHLRHRHRRVRPITPGRP
ncbi:hypothetical protein D3C59_36345 [Streptomyces sp. SHP22-7]|nr:hypothetical protein D3C59_36345 [Streptomyces sp. SHP22-7]